MNMYGDYILIDPELEKDRQVGHIHIPSGGGDAKRFSRCKILRVGPGLVMASGELNPVDIDPGSRVLYFREGAFDLAVGDKIMQIIGERSIIAILDLKEIESQDPLKQEGATDANAN